MSHFTVLVATLGNDSLDGESVVESILAPYNEEIQVDPYWETEDLKWEREYYASEKFEPQPGTERLKAGATDEELVAWLNAYHDDEAIDGVGLYRIEDGVIQRRSTYNPDSKWDWYSVGGRWTGGLLLKQGATGVTGRPGVMMEANDDPNYADQAFKRDIAIDVMRQTREDEAQATWAKWQKIVAEHGTPLTFAEVLAKHGLTDEKIVRRRQEEAAKHEADETYKAQDVLADARTEYHAQPAVKAAKAEKLIGEFFDSVDEKFLAHTHDSFVEAATLGALCGYAFLSEKTGWLEAGQMGWFGMGSDTPASTLDFRRKVAQEIDALPDDAVLTFVDCHI